MEYSAASAASTATLAAATLLTASAVHASQVQLCNGLLPKVLCQCQAQQTMCVISAKHPAGSIELQGMTTASSMSGQMF